MADPFTIGAGVALLGIGLPGRGVSGGGVVAPSDLAAFKARAVFPLGAWRGLRPARSQEYRAPDHHGIDVMYRRPGGSADPSAPYPPGSVDGSRNHFCPPGVLVHAVADGMLWNSGSAPTGLYVTIDHGAPWATFYVHLESLLVPSGVSRGSGRHSIKAGQPLGTVGWSPRDAAKLRHLHIEAWYRGGSAAHVDPWPILESARLPEAT